MIYVTIKKKLWEEPKKKELCLQMLTLSFLWWFQKNSSELIIFLMTFSLSMLKCVFSISKSFKINNLKMFFFVVISVFCLTITFFLLYNYEWYDSNWHSRHRIFIFFFFCYPQLSSSSTTITSTSKRCNNKLEVIWQ